MKVAKSNTLNLYSFLETRGLFEKGTPFDIEKAKKEYWKNYRRNYNRNRRSKNKSYLITLSVKEAEFVQRKATKHQLKPTSYIKQSVLSDNSMFIDKASIAHIRELVILHHTELILVSDNDQLPRSIIDTLIQQSTEIEQEVLKFFSSFK